MGPSSPWVQPRSDRVVDERGEPGTGGGKAGDGRARAHGGGRVWVWCGPPRARGRAGARGRRAWAPRSPPSSSVRPSPAPPRPPLRGIRRVPRPRHPPLSRTTSATARHSTARRTPRPARRAGPAGSAGRRPPRRGPAGGWGTGHWGGRARRGYSYPRPSDGMARPEGPDPRPVGCDGHHVNVCRVLQPEPHSIGASGGCDEGLHDGQRRGTEPRGRAADAARALHPGELRPTRARTSAATRARAAPARSTSTVSR